MARSSSPERWMRRAIQLSKRGYPAPNPHVGCVLVKDGEIVGEGWHDYAGGAHAEAMALRQAALHAKGCEAFVTLEPCNHQGRQPPCTQALIRAQVKKAWIACRDPNPFVQGRGAEALRVAGIEVTESFLDADAEKENTPWLTSMRLRRPYVTVKAAMTLDGRIALPNGESKWITGEKARKEAHRLRAQMGAVLVGAGTVTVDNPALTARLPRVKNQPVRIVLDPERRLSEEHRVFQQDTGFIRVVRKGVGVEGDLEVDSDRDGFKLGQLLEQLWERGMTGLLVEGGAKTITSFVKAGLVDRLVLFAGNVTFGAGPTWLESPLSQNILEAPRWKLESAKALGYDVCMKFELLDRP